MDVQSRRKTTAPVREKDISRSSSRLWQQMWSFPRRSQSSPLGSMKHHIPDSVAPADAVPIPPQPT